MGTCPLQAQEERGARLLSAIHSFGLEVSRSTDREVGAFREKDCDIPWVVDHVEQVPVVVRAGNVRGEKVATHGVMPQGKERIPDSAGILAGNENFQSGGGDGVHGCFLVRCGELRDIVRSFKDISSMSVRDG